MPRHIVPREMTIEIRLPPEVSVILKDIHTRRDDITICVLAVVVSVVILALKGVFTRK